MSERLTWLRDDLKALADEGLLRQRRDFSPLAGMGYVVDGRKVWDFASNDYLDLAGDSRVIAAAADVLHSHGVGAKASPLVSGRSDIHVALEQTLIQFEGTEAAILFPTGMAANVGTVAALAGPGDAVFCDRLNHASLVDGCRFSGARLRVYRHDDLGRLDEALGRESARRKFIITDSVFSMDGDLAPLPELCEIGERHGADMIVDEAHGTGVFGACGRGVAELQGVEDRIAVKVGTLSKAIGSLGGFVTGTSALIEFLWNKARTQIYSTALPPALCAAAKESIQIIQAEPARRERLHRIALSFRDQLHGSGISPVAGSTGPIVPIVLHQPEAAMQIAGKLLAEGFLVAAIRPPTVPRGTSRLRVTLHANLPEVVVRMLAQRIGELIAAT
jgi:8-amino-7-oxononanoate synthase